jgi:ABC-type sugar transport system, permease component
MKKNPGEKVFDVFLVIMMGAVLLITLYPFYYCVILSFNNGHDTNLGGIYFLPRVFTLKNYEYVFVNNALFKAFFITVSRTVLGTFISVLFTALVSYGLSKKDLMFRKFYMVAGIITMYFNGGLIPLYFVLKYMGLINNFLVFIVPYMLSFYNVILFIAFYSGIPSSLKESARIDGAGEMYTFFRIILPLSKPIIATIALFNGIEQWNSWFDSQFFTTNPNLKTLQMILYQIIALAQGQEKLKRQLGMSNDNAYVTIESVRYATMIVAIGPIIFIYPFVQKYFMKGMMIGAIKG